MSRIFARLNSRPRLTLLFISIFVKLVAAGVSGVGFFLASPLFALPGIFLWLLWFWLLFRIADKRSDESLLPKQRWMKPAAVALSCLIAVAGVGWVTTVSMTTADRAASESQDPSEISTAISELFGYNDATALCQQAADNLFEGENPYAHPNIVTASLKYGGASLKLTPLMRGSFAAVFPYPTQDQLLQVWQQALQNPAQPPLEIESSLDYPSGSFLLLAPFIAAGITDIRIVYAILLLLAVGYAAWLMPKYRWLMLATVLLSLEIPNLILIGETGALQFPFLLLGFLLVRKRLWVSAVLMGIAISIKQVSWFYMAFYMVMVYKEIGLRRLLQVSCVAVLIFIGFNTPFIAMDPGLWLSSVLAPMANPMFPIGIGPVSVVTSGIVSFDNRLVFAVLEFVVFVGSLVWYYRHYRRYAYAGPVLAVLPLFFAWRSMWTYLFFVDLIVFGMLLYNEYSINRPVEAV